MKFKILFLPNFTDFGRDALAPGKSAPMIVPKEKKWLRNNLIFYCKIYSQGLCTVNIKIYAIPLIYWEMTKNETQSLICCSRQPAMQGVRRLKMQFSQKRYTIFSDFLTHNLLMSVQIIIIFSLQHASEQSSAQYLGNIFALLCTQHDGCQVRSLERALHVRNSVSHFCRAMLCVSATYAIMPSPVRLSVRLLSRSWILSKG